jgi:AraC family transcriptional regulator
MQTKLPAGKLYGSNLKTRQVAGLRLAEVAYCAGYQTPEHSHDLPQLCLVRKGIFAEVYDRRHREVRPLSLITRPAGENHAQYFNRSEVHCLIIEVERGWLQGVRERDVSLETSAAFHGGLSVWLATRLYKEFQLGDNASSLAIEGLALELMADLSRQNVKTPGRKPPKSIKQTRELLHAHFSESLTLEDIGKSVGTHPVHLARIFRRYHHCTIGEYVRKLRIESACHEISTTDSQLALIASRNGFYDQSHFSRTFKRVMGITPAQYRAAFRSR